MTVPLAQQLSALDLTIRIMSGGAPKPSRKEAAYLIERLKAADATLYYVQRNEAAIKAIDAARREAERAEKAS